MADEAVFRFVLDEGTGSGQPGSPTSPQPKPRPRTPGDPQNVAVDALNRLEKTVTRFTAAAVAASPFLAPLALSAVERGFSGLRGLAGRFGRGPAAAGREEIPLSPGRSLIITPPPGVPGRPRPAATPGGRAASGLGRLAATAGRAAGVIGVVIGAFAALRGAVGLLERSSLKAAQKFSEFAPTIAGEQAAADLGQRLRDRRRALAREQASAQLIRARERRQEAQETLFFGLTTAVGNLKDSFLGGLADLEAGILENIADALGIKKAETPLTLDELIRSPEWLEGTFPGFLDPGESAKGNIDINKAKFEGLKVRVPGQGLIDVGPLP